MSVFFDSVFQDLLAVFILVTIGLYMYSQAKGVSMKNLLLDLKEVFK